VAFSVKFTPGLMLISVDLGIAGIIKMHRLSLNWNILSKYQAVNTIGKYVDPNWTKSS